MEGENRLPPEVLWPANMDDSMRTHPPYKPTKEAKCNKIIEKSIVKEINT